MSSDTFLNGMLVVIRSPETQASRREAIRETWGADLRGLGAEVLFSVHNPQIHSPSTAGDILMIPGQDGHMHLTPRMLHTFRWALARPDWTHLFSLDDDCYVIAKRLREISWRDQDVFGHQNDRWYMSGGPGMVLSRRAVERVLYFLSRDDCAIGAILSITAPPDFKITHSGTKFRPWKEHGWPTKDNDTAVQHYVRTAQEMHQLSAESKTWQT